LSRALFASFTFPFFFFAKFVILATFAAIFVDKHFAVVGKIFVALAKFAKFAACRGPSLPFSIFLSFSLLNLSLYLWFLLTSFVPLQAKSLLLLLHFHFLATYASFVIFATFLKDSCNEFLFSHFLLKLISRFC